MAEYQNREKFEQLADRLEKDPHNFAKRALAGELRALEFDDFANNRYPAPKMTLVQKLEEVGYREEAEKVKNGDYDQ